MFASLAVGLMLPSVLTRRKSRSFVLPLPPHRRSWTTHKQPYAPWSDVTVLVAALKQLALARRMGAQAQAQARVLAHRTRATRRE